MGEEGLQPGKDFLGRQRRKGELRVGGIGRQKEEESVENGFLVAFSPCWGRKGNTVTCWERRFGTAKVEDEDNNRSSHRREGD